LRRHAPFIFIGILLLDRFLNIGIISKLFLYPILHIAHLFGGDNFFRLIGIM